MSPATPPPTTVRAELEKLLRPLVPRDWKIIRWQVEPEQLTAPTIVLKQSRIEPHNTAPIAQHLTHMVVTLASAHEDFTKGEDELDLIVLDLWEWLEKLPIQINVRSAEKVLFAKRYAAYDITVEIDTEK